MYQVEPFNRIALSDGAVRLKPIVDVVVWWSWQVTVEGGKAEGPYPPLRLTFVNDTAASNDKVRGQSTEMAGQSWTLADVGR